MPDDDIVNPNLASRYRKPYKQLCEGFYGSEIIAQEIARGLVKDIQRYGNPPIELIKHYLFHVSIDDNQLLFRYRSAIPGHVADLIDLAFAVYVADRLSNRKSNHPRRIHLALPVRNAATLNSVRVIDLLKKTLF